MTKCTDIISADRCTCEWPVEVARNPKLCFGLVCLKRTWHIYSDNMDTLVDWMLAFKVAARIGLAVPVGNPLTPGLDEVIVVFLKKGKIKIK